MKDTYTLKQILFALRKEYIEVEKQLNELKKYVEITGKIENVRFRLTSPEKIHLFLEKRQNLLDEIKKHLGIYNYGAYFYNVADDIMPSYYVEGKEVCTISDLKSLKSDIDKILESEFSKNIELNDRIGILCNDNNTSSLLMTTMAMQLMDYSETTSEKNFELSYSASDDSFIFESKDKIITPDEVYKQFNLNFNKRYFNDYYRHILNNYEEKELDIEDNFNSNKSKLIIVEEPKKLILKPKNII